MIIIGVMIAAILSLVMSFVSLMMACEGLVWIFLIACVIIVALRFIKNIEKPKEVPGKEETKTEPEVFRYHLVNVSTKKVVGQTNDYQEAFKMKHKMKGPVMIKDTWGFKHDKKNVSNCRRS